jgi:hypothetical protein
MSAGKGKRSVPEVPPTPHDTDAMDLRGAVKRQYFLVLKRFAIRLAIFLPLWLLVFVTNNDYLLPVSLVGFFGLLFSAIRLWSSASWIRRCSRAFREYPLRFRSPFVKLDIERGRLLIFRLDDEESGAPVMSGVNISGTGWPTGIDDGLWFAGDDLFGGAALVPRTGELLFMQPQEWILMTEQRQNADAERIQRAKRAGIKGYVSLRH